MNKRKHGLVLGDDGEVLSEVLSLPKKPKRSIGSGFRRAGWRAIAVLLILAVGILIGVFAYGHYQAGTKPAVAVESIPTASPVPTSNKTTVTPVATVPSGASQILWVSNCDPRTDSGHCNQKLATLTEFYATIQNLGASIVYALPKASTDLLPYDVVVLDYCDFAASALPEQLLRDYVWGGGSLIVMGDNFCVGVHVDNKLGSSAEAATLLTMSWGIRFTGDDDKNNPEISTFVDHPLTAGIKTIYSFRHAYLAVESPASAIALVNNEAAIALYSGTGTVVAIPNTGFEWGSAFKSQIGTADNFAFWRNSLIWLTQQTRTKRRS